MERSASPLFESIDPVAAVTLLIDLGPRIPDPGLVWGRRKGKRERGKGKEEVGVYKIRDARYVLRTC